MARLLAEFAAGYCETQLQACQERESFWKNQVTLPLNNVAELGNEEFNG
jgi:hypothetical protein